MIVMKTALGPANYVATGINVVIGDLERVEHLGSGFVGGTFTGSGIKATVWVTSSCEVKPIVTKVSGNVCGVEMFTTSGAVGASTIFLATSLVVIAEGY